MDGRVLLPMVPLGIFFGIQKLSARTRFGSVSDSRTVSSTNPACFFKIGSTLSLRVFESSFAFSRLGGYFNSSRKHGSTPYWSCLGRRRSKLTGGGCDLGGVGLVTNCLTTIDSGLDRRRRSQSGVNFNCPNFLVGQGRCWGALEERCDGVLAWPMRQLKG